MTQQLYPGLNLGDAHGEDHAKSETLLFGFWVFLMSDLILFGMLFSTYVVMRDATAGGPGPEDLFDLGSVALQTGALLLSSLTCGMASLALKYDDASDAPVLPRTLGKWLVLTFLFGAVFLALEVHDFLTMFAAGATPMRSGWMSAFTALVGLHGLHITVGLIWILVLISQIEMKPLRGVIKQRIMMWALYWHFLDIIWIGIFSIVFLGGLL
ncbi:MAG: cytochrome c oxidase subunit 3 [Rhodobacteraceae bacterium]|nr:cytochrome c oxidase subunit 3 [Paracoccaceae bacterium]